MVLLPTQTQNSSSSSLLRGQNNIGLGKVEKNDLLFNAGLSVGEDSNYIQKRVGGVWYGAVHTPYHVMVLLSHDAKLSNQMNFFNSSFLD